MLFDVFKPIKTKSGKIAPGVKPNKMNLVQAFDLVTNDKHFKDVLVQVAAGNKEIKSQLPAICFMGRGEKREAAAMTPTQFISIDIDHVEDVERAWNTLKTIMGKTYIDEDVLVAHKTPSGHGLRIVVSAPVGVTKVTDALQQLNDEFHFDHHGDFDTACKDLSRLSFLVSWDYVLYFNQSFALRENDPERSIEQSGENIETRTETESVKSEIPDFSEEEKQKYESMTWRGQSIQPIIEKYEEVFGKPVEGDGETHNYYNSLVKYFRHLCANNKRCLLYLLPRYGHSAEECWSQIRSICKTNTLSSLPKEFYFFLKDNGFYVPREKALTPLQEFMLSDKDTDTPPPPYIPPIFRDFVEGAPKDFLIPALNALMPILGTLTSYVQAEYPYDQRMHTTSFFSIITAPPGSGKGFVERFMDVLFEDLKLRDLIQTKREEFFLNFQRTKGANEKSPNNPNTSLRIIPAKNSESEFLEKQGLNKGYHMFTFAAEMDSWAKGARAAGGNKDDMIRVAWDNGEYGQAFKSSNTFKGIVRLYWNVLILGTWQQVEHYFKSVENGLVQRCCFTELRNQDFAMPQTWKPMTEQSMRRVRQFMHKCDAMSYETPCDIHPEDLVGLTEKQFDEEVPWRFQFKPRITVDCSWIMPTIDKFHREQIELAASDVDRARDVFRRRTAVRGFRLALLCTQCFHKFNKRNQADCIKFINWWMHRDLEESLALWGAKYNETTDTAVSIPKRSVMVALDNTFTKNDVYTVCLKQGIKTPMRIIIHQWKKLGLIEQTEKGTYKKIRKDAKD